MPLKSNEPWPSRHVDQAGRSRSTVCFAVDGQLSCYRSCDPHYSPTAIADTFGAPRLRVIATTVVPKLDADTAFATSSTMACAMSSKGDGVFCWTYEPSCGRSAGFAQHITFPTDRE